MSLTRTVALTPKALLHPKALFWIAPVMLGLTSVAAAGISEQSGLVQAASRCADHGPGFVDVGNGTCARSGGHVRVGTRKANVNAWTTDGTSNAGLRADSAGMLRDAGDSGHLRVHNGLDSLSPFR